MDRPNNSPVSVNSYIKTVPSQCRPENDDELDLLKQDYDPYAYYRQFAPFIKLNTRRRIEPKFVDLPNNTSPREPKRKKKRSSSAQEIEPQFPIYLAWRPEKMHFDIDKQPTVQKLCVANRSSRSLYVSCCGLWDDTARLGASWRCYPRTRLLLAPGLMGVIYVRANPRVGSPVPCAFIGLQLAASNIRDQITGYYVVPIEVKFYNYTAEETLQEE